MSGLITFGETMVSFVPGETNVLRYVKNYSACIAGAESNTAIGFAKLGGRAVWFSRLGKDEFGHFVLNSIRAEGVDCSRVLFDDDHPTGLMFKERGPSETKVYYYRAGSAASHLEAQDIEKTSFSGFDVLFLTGITPVLSQSCMEAVETAVDKAASEHMTLAFDPNIRKRLWKDRDFTPVIDKIISKSQIVLMGLDEARILYGLEEEERICDLIFSKGSARYIAVKDGSRGAYVSDGNTQKKIPPYPCKSIEPVGAGDGFNAGFLKGIMDGKDVITAGRMGSICGAMATQTTGDTEGYPDSEVLEEAMQGKEVILR